MSKPQHKDGSFIWFECGTTDAAKARDFYTELFGWTFEDVPMPGVDATYTLLKLDGQDVAGLHGMAGEQTGMPPCWMAYVQVSDVDDSTRRAKTLGATIVNEPMDVPGVGRMAHFQDPTGAHLAFFKPGEHPGTIERGPGAGRFGWAELQTGDTGKAKAFYTELFGWSTKEDSAAGMEYTEFLVDGESIAGMMPLSAMHGDAPPNWMPYVQVDDCHATAGKATKLGGRIIVPPTDIPKVGTFAVIQDPTSAVIAFIKLSG